MTFDESKPIINLPDLLFVKYCTETFGLNRGVYNTIDEWFYLENVQDIKVRRENILDFLLYTSESMDKGDRKGKLKFGKGNLVNQLEEYSEHQVILV
ncbi:hypothetical protein ACFPRA_12685 [Sporosarcina soli]|uniref:Uncharacterized protein n=1 Tax=Sporosarcina soli TaxID=334736 RepID=A0ABW0TMV6_9BACL